MKTSNNGITFITKHEGLRLKAYQDSIGIWTIGIGNTYYEDGSKVKEGDEITLERANSLFRHVLTPYELGVDVRTNDNITQNQFDALVSFTYNVGVTNFSKSTLLKKININPNDPTIKDEFLKWSRAGGRVIQGLLNRRKAEASLYFS